MYVLIIIHLTCASLGETVWTRQSYLALAVFADVLYHCIKTCGKDLLIVIESKSKTKINLMTFSSLPLIFSFCVVNFPQQHLLSRRLCTPKLQNIASSNERAYNQNLKDGRLTQAYFPPTIFVKNAF